MFAATLSIAEHNAVSGDPSPGGNNQVLAQSDLPLQAGQTLNLDLSRLWKIASAHKVVAGSFDPEMVWQLPEEQFLPTAGQVVRTKAGERTMARIRLNATGEPRGLVLTANIARLDMVQMAYRYDNGPWIKAIAGDKTAMSRWPFPNHEPAFNILAREATIDLVVQVDHIGAWKADFVLQDSISFHGGNTGFLLLMGLLVGVNLVLALVAGSAAWTFRRWGFWAVAVMAVTIVLQTAFNSGIAGMLLGHSSHSLNDEAKFATNFLWCAVFPWVTAVLIGQRSQDPWLWRLVIVLVCIGLVGGVFLADYNLRSSMAVWVPVFLLACVVLSVFMAVQAVRRQQMHSWQTMAGVLLYVSALCVSVSIYFGWISSDVSTALSSVLTMLSALIFLHVLVLQHRQGRMVMSRAKSSAGRDLLTGLLNARGFSEALSRTIDRMEDETTHAVVFYIAFSDASQSRERYGEEGFEISLVQIAASISSIAAVNDSVARVADNAFAVCVTMPRDPMVANRYATRLLSRILSLANHLAPLASTAKIAITWVPTFAKNLPELQRRSLRAIEKLTSAKRIAWVGGAYAQLDFSDTPEKNSDISTQTRPEIESNRDDPLPSIPGLDMSQPGTLPTRRDGRAG